MAEKDQVESARLSFETSYLGRGWAFPVRWNVEQDGLAVAMTEQLEDIRQSIRLILETALGERVMRPEFGSTIGRFVFASIDMQTRTNLAHAARRALLLWERRIRDVEVTVDEHTSDTNRLNVLIEFVVDTHRMRQSLVFPFYLEQPEGL